MKFSISGIVMFLITAFFFMRCGNGRPEFSIEVQQSDTNALLIGLHAFDDNTVWSSGTNETVIRSIDRGASWNVYQYGSRDSLQFRDIHAFSRKKAIVLSAGSGDQSRILTFHIDSGFTETYRMEHPDGFLNSLDFWDAQQGLAFGDAVDSKPFILKTDNGGKSWYRIRNSKLPDAGEGEGGFASSGTNIEMRKNGQAWIGTGAGGNARILYTGDFGENWVVLETPMVKGDMAGITSVRFRGKQGVIAGGDLNQPQSRFPRVYKTENGGLFWEPTSSVKIAGPIYCVATARLENHLILVVTGPQGADLSIDFGDRWINISRNELWTADMLNSGIGWVAGRNGSIVKIEIQTKK